MSPVVSSTLTSERSPSGARDVKRTGACGEGASACVRPAPSTTESRSLLANLALLSATDAVTLMPKHIAQIYAAEGRVAILPLPPCEALGPLQMAWNDGRLHPAAELFAEHLRSVARRLA